ncbi:MAG: hypothetical protein ACJA0X_002546 [Cyclobacteriaceae bacterium]|jgi:hypothetical protein
MTLTSAINIPIAAFVFGATIWFFFFQSPYLLKKIGRDAFVPIQMQLTVLLFNVLLILTTALFINTIVHNKINSNVFISAGIVLLGTAINKFFIIPKALRAGGSGLKEVKGENNKGTVANFASLGVGSKTKVLHRLVVVFVVVMLAGTIWHGLTLLTYITNLQHGI